MLDKYGKNIHSEYVILIAWQQWSCERVSMLLYTYIACCILQLIQENRTLILYSGNVIAPKNGRADCTELEKKSIMHIYQRYLDNFNRMSMKRERF
jgi:hypothetical protein